MTRGTPCEGSTSAKFLASPRSDIDAGPEPVAYEFDGGGTSFRPIGARGVGERAGTPKPKDMLKYLRRAPKVSPADEDRP